MLKDRLKKYSQKVHLLLLLLLHGNRLGMSHRQCFHKLLTRSAVPYACNQQSNSLQLSDFLHAGFIIIVLWLLLLVLSLLLS